MDSINTGYERTSHEISETLELACIKPTEVNNVTQTVYYTLDNNLSKDIKLLELDEHLLNSLEKGETMYFKGHKKDPAVLCSKTKTYDIKEAETSNSCLLVPNLKFSEQTQGSTSERIVDKLKICGIYHTYYEVRNSKPKVERLVTLLEPSAYRGKEYESAVDTECMYDWNKLQSEIQASEAELKQALTDYLVVNIDGHLRLISFEYEAICITRMLDIFDEMSWELNEIDKEVTYELLQTLISEEIFETLFEKYAFLSEKKKSDGTPLYSYSEEKCTKTLAKVLLTAAPTSEYNQFMESWRIGTPEKMSPKDEYLRGIAFIAWNQSNKRKEVAALFEENLPTGIVERLNELFKVKEKWTLNEITPYVMNITTSQLNVNALLTKYARCSTVDGVKYYSSRYGK